MPVNYQLPSSFGAADTLCGCLPFCGLVTEGGMNIGSCLFLSFGCKSRETQTDFLALIKIIYLA